ncbi:MAG TPA: hypothetical protein VJ978_03185, partial [Nitriliruptoraceae bacterium]|nr:hypothetical protein [Nitriliruptoraceae bacterium]
MNDQTDAKAIADDPAYPATDREPDLGLPPEVTIGRRVRTLDVVTAPRRADTEGLRPTLYTGDVILLHCPTEQER